MWHLTPTSSNVKIGKVPVSTSGKQTCPSECPFKDNGCYADNGPLAIHWKAVSEGRRGFQSFAEFCAAIASLPAGQFWRHNQAGDLAGNNSGTIDALKLQKLCEANEGKRGFTYTHYNPFSIMNAAAIKAANLLGFTVNLSANNLKQADQYAKLNIGPVVVTLPHNAPKLGNRTPGGRVVTVCPAQTQDDMTCEKCQLCQVSNRKTIVGFLAHGSRKAKVDAIASFEV